MSKPLVLRIDVVEGGVGAERAVVEGLGAVGAASAEVFVAAEA